MLRIRFEGCGTSKEFGPVTSLRIESDSVRTPEQGEFARFHDGYWRNSDEDFISLVIDNHCEVHFEDAHARSGPWGPFDRLRSAGGSIWGSEPRRDHLIARYGGQGGQWASPLDPRRPWPTVVVSPLAKAP